MKVALFDKKGKKVTSGVELNDKVFGDKVNDKLLAQYVYVYLGNQREAVAHTKDRSEVRGGGRKPFAQKGTGRARAGSSRSPIWTGGGVTFGPNKEQNWKKSITKSMKRAAFRSAFSKLAAEKKLTVVEGIEINESKELTKQAQKFLKSLNSGKKVLIVTPDVNEVVMKAFSNISGVRVTQVGELNPYQILNAREIIIFKDAVTYTDKWA